MNLTLSMIQPVAPWITWMFSKRWLTVELMTHFGFSSGNSVIESNKIGRYCGDTIPNPIFPENTNQMLLKFRSDQLVSGKGFDLSYTSNQQQCGGNLTGTHGNVYMSYWPEVRSMIHKLWIITHTNYVQTYDQGLNCVWVIEVPPTRKIKIHFDQINIRWNPTAGTCSGDAVRAYNGIFGTPSASYIVGYCGVGAVADIQGNSNVMSFQFISQANTSDADRAGYNGFVIRWES